jgi:hypothetical protein
MEKERGRLSREAGQIDSARRFETDRKTLVSSSSAREAVTTGGAVSAINRSEFGGQKFRGREDRIALDCFS